MSDKTYNGWSNYETWAVKLWLDNDQGTQELMQDMARHERTAYKLADALKDMIEDNTPDLGASMYADLLNAALSEVDYREIAENILEDMEDEDDSEDN